MCVFIYTHAYDYGFRSMRKNSQFLSHLKPCGQLKRQISERGNTVKHYQYVIAKASEFFRFFLEISFSQERETMRP